MSLVCVSSTKEAVVVGTELSEGDGEKEREAKVSRASQFSRKDFGFSCAGNGPSLEGLEQKRHNFICTLVHKVDTRVDQVCSNQREEKEFNL